MNSLFCPKLEEDTLHARRQFVVLHVPVEQMLRIMPPLSILPLHLAQPLLLIQHLTLELLDQAE